MRAMKARRRKAVPRRSPNWNHDGDEDDGDDDDDHDDGDDDLCIALLQ